MLYVQVNGWSYVNHPVSGTDLGLTPSFSFCAEICSTFWRKGSRRPLKGFSTSNFFERSVFVGRVGKGYETVLEVGGQRFIN